MSFHVFGTIYTIAAQIVVSSQKVLILRLNEDPMDGTDGQNRTIFLPYSSEGNCYGDFVYPFHGQP